MFLSSSSVCRGAGRSGGSRAAHSLPLLVTAFFTILLAMVDSGSAATRSRRLAPPDSTGVRRDTLVIDAHGLTLTSDSRSSRDKDTIVIDDEDGDAVSIDLGRHGRIRVNNRGSSGDLVLMGDDVMVEKDEVVTGDAVAIGGDVVVYGRVMGDVVAIGGDVSLGDSAWVGGDAVSIGGGLEKSKTARVNGEAVQIGVKLPALFFPKSHDRHESSWGSLFFWVVFYLVMFAFAALAIFLTRDRIGHASSYLAREPFPALLLGLLSPVLVLIAFALLVITIIGILPALVLICLYPVFVFLGWVVVGHRVGHAVGSNGGAITVRTTFSGLLVISGLHILHVLLRALGVGGIVGFFVAMAGVMVASTAALLGLGAIIGTRFRRPPAVVPAVPGMAPPPAGPYATFPGASYPPPPPPGDSFPPPAPPAGP